MGSFFYGNSFGKNNGLFPYITSKMNSNISLQDSSFKQENNEKMATARVVIGKMIKNTGSFYTFETSFFGGWKRVPILILQNQRIHFDQEDYKALSKTLVSGIYKTFLELHKEEKTIN